MKKNIILKTDLSEPQIIYRSKKKSFFIVFILFFMAILPFYALLFGKVKPNEKWPVIFGLVLTLCIAVVCLLIGSKKATYFKLSNTGFEISLCYIKRKYFWRDITDFGVHLVLNGNPIIGFNIRDGYQNNSVFMKKANGEMFPYKYQISNNFGIDGITLLNHLNEMLLKYKT